MIYANRDNWDGDLFYVGGVLVEFAPNEQTQVEIKEGILKILAGVFKDCYLLESVTIPNSVTEIGSEAFSGCGKLKSVKLPESLKTIESFLFNDCESLASIVIPDSVTTIESRAFEDCEKLESVSIGSGVRYIGSEAFSVFGQASLSRVYIHSISSWCEIEFEDEYANPCNQGYVSLYIGQNQLTTINLPGDLVSIKPYSFYGVRFEKIYLPATIQKIGASAFGFGNHIASVYYGGDAAGWCSIDFEDERSNPLCGGNFLHLKNDSDPVFELEIPAEVQQIKNYAFFGVYGVFFITFEEGSCCTSIGDYAFWNIGTLRSITIPAGVTHIGENAFPGSDSNPEE